MHDTEPEVITPMLAFSGDIEHEYVLPVPDHLPDIDITCTEDVKGTLTFELVPSPETKARMDETLRRAVEAVKAALKEAEGHGYD